jgi:hypothetical protein
MTEPDLYGAPYEWSPQRRRRWLLPLVTALLLLAGAGGIAVALYPDHRMPWQHQRHYPVQVERNFLVSCEQLAEGDATACECALDKIEARYSLREFNRLEVRGISGGQDSISPELADVVRGC